MGVGMKVGVAVGVAVAVAGRVSVAVLEAVAVGVGNPLPQITLVLPKYSMLASQAWKARSPGSQRLVSTKSNQYR